MWLDERTRFCNAVAVDTSGSATKLIGDVVDTGDPRDLGVEGPYLIIQVTTAFAGGTSCQFVLASDAQAALAADGAETRHYTSDVFTVAQLTAGFSLSVKLPSGDTARGEDTIGYERYLGIETIQVGTMTAGAISAFLSPDPYGTGVVMYPDGSN